MVWFVPFLNFNQLHALWFIVSRLFNMKRTRTVNEYHEMGKDDFCSLTPFCPGPSVISTGVKFLMRNC